jgi:hypothetical protein
MHAISGSGQANLCRCGLVCEIKYHQWFKLPWQRTHGLNNAITIRERLRNSRCRGHYVGHNDCSAEIASQVCTGSLQGGPVSQVHMPVIRAGNGQFDHEEPYGLKKTD